MTMIQIDPFIDNKIQEIVIAYYQEKQIVDEFTIENIIVCKKNGIPECGFEIFSGEIFEINCNGFIYVKLKESGWTPPYSFDILRLKLKSDIQAKDFQIIDKGNIVSPLSFRRKPFSFVKNAE